MFDSCCMRCGEFGVGRGSLMAWMGIVNFVTGTCMARHEDRCK